MRVRERLRGEGFADLEAVGVNGFAGLRVGGRGRGGDVAVDVAARRERGEEGLVDLGDQRAQAGFYDAVKLDALTRGDAQGVVAVLGGEVVEGDPLGRGHDAARDAAADHHDVFLACLAEVAVVLLVNAVKLHELLVIGREMIGGLVGDGGRELAGENGIVLLEDFVFVYRRRDGFRHDKEKSCTTGRRGKI